MQVIHTLLPYQDELLGRQLTAFLGETDPAGVALLRAHIEWIEIGSGETLMEQGEAGESMFMVISGRLRAYIRDENGPERAVREMSRGQVIGEMSLYTGAPRSATVVAIRDSVLIRLDKVAFNKLLASSAQASIGLTQQLIRRLQTERARVPVEKPVITGLMAVTAGVDLADFGTRFAVSMAAAGRVQRIDSALLATKLQALGLSADDDQNPEVNRQVAMILDQIEAENDFVLMVADAELNAWTRRCASHCDELLLVANAHEPVRLHPTETDFLMLRPPRAAAAQVLVLLHAADKRTPMNTHAWLNRRPVADHVHLRLGSARDMARLARLQTRTAVGLVLAGGGARGLSQLGVYRALLERGVEVDCVGGTSIGALMAMLVASNQPLEQVLQVARKAFASNPTSDFNWLPLISLIKGQRLRRLVRESVMDLFGTDPDIEDLWKNFYCIATNYSTASEMVLRRGNLDRAMRASIAIPGALPPVIFEGDLLCDGGTFNNFPVDVMRKMRGVGTVLGVDLSFGPPRKIPHSEVPGTWALLRDKLRPRDKRRYRLPSIASILMNVTILYSVSRHREARAATDVYFNPPLHRVGMLEWHKFDQIVRQGYSHGNEVLQALPPEVLAQLVDARP
ncbi:MAG: patatin-like phospholipase family protein [Hydrogenophaga sp.]|uniref:patatin-like phospholipase family protein n=1 Tax=Hydrogenophaga sp. TaxID=1904254 RepID=UPI001BBBBE57|nr:patatin-like phospholipase family protein [Hydrogenophaga sp.]MBS3910495.1 patatin-like phospholipase family protein [Hydrogenophaga sp.]MDP2162840.1 patatin-like phospholipase family protein [Hydrogenophaga sp.]MDP3476641.1 patatin-like phospholipase family protein [Hydrogenophaga sp.]